MRDGQIEFLIRRQLSSVCVRGIADELLRLNNLHFQPLLLRGRTRAAFEYVEKEAAKVDKPEGAAHKGILRHSRKQRSVGFLKRRIAVPRDETMNVGLDRTIEIEVRHS